MKFHLLFIYALLLLFGLSAFSQRKPLQFENLGTAQGLSQSNVTCILQDSRGFMWFGTQDGLNKYDGYKFTTYKTDPSNPNSISGNLIKSIAESGNGNLWIGTSGGGLCLYEKDKNQFKRFKHDASNVNSLCSDFVTSVLEDENEILWIGTEAGLDYLDNRTNKFHHFKKNDDRPGSLSDDYVRRVYQDKNHTMWIATLTGGLNVYNNKTGDFTSFKHNEKDNKSIISNNVYTLFEDSKQRLWIGTDGAGLDLFDRNKNEFTHYRHDEKNANSLPENSVYAINEDLKNNLWIGTENGGLSILNYEKGIFENYTVDEVDDQSISNNSIHSLYRDKKNNMWVGNYANGVDFSNQDKGKFGHLKHQSQKNSLTNNYVLSITEDHNKKIWIGTDGGGVDLYDPATGNFKHHLHEKNNPNSICGNYVLTVCEDSKGCIWIGTWNDGITVIDPVKNSYRHYKNNPADSTSLSNNNAWKIYEDKNKNIWVGTNGGGLNKLNADGKTFTRYLNKKGDERSISNNKIYSIFEDSDGNIWICTDGGGLDVMEKNSPGFTSFQATKKAGALPGNSIMNVLEDKHKNIWIATRDGLCRFDKKSRYFTNYTVANGLSHNVVMGMLEDANGHIWISSYHGISDFDPEAQTFKTYNVSDGLQANEFKQQAFCKSQSGILYFGGTNGFNQFNPADIKRDPFDPPLVLTNFQVFNKDVPIAVDDNDASPLKKSITETSSITLPYSSAVFSIEFASLNFTSSDRKRYTYMLEGFDESWNEAGVARMATYTNLDPGTYTFKVKGLNNEGEWSSKVTTLKIIITPPFWLTWWFKLLVIIAIASATVLFFKYRLRMIKSQKRELQKRVQHQTIQLVASAKEAERSKQEAVQARNETQQLNNELKIKNKELEQFAYVASHDLQEPLRTTTSFAELIQKKYKGQIDERADQYINYIIEASDRMRVLVRDLLEFSRIGTNGVPERIDTNKVIKTVLNDLTVARQEAGADIKFEDLPVINGYPTEIKLLFQNLIINAIKFRKKDQHPQITIEAKKAGTYWEFSFADNGIGIEKEHSDKIFEIFQRLHSRKEYQGSGIGLSHCKKIVELHNGNIWVESIPGDGSTFYFTIPEHNYL